MYGLDELIVPAVIHEQLAAVGEEGFEVGVVGIEQTVVDLVGEGDVFVEVEGQVVPLGIFEDHILKMRDRNRERLRAGQRGPYQFAARRHPGEDGLARFSVGSGVDFAGGVDLRRSQAAIGFAGLAEHRADRSGSAQDRRSSRPLRHPDCRTPPTPLGEAHPD